MTGPAPKNVLVVDQGSDTLKWGLTTAEAPRFATNPHLITTNTHHMPHSQTQTHMQKTDAHNTRVIPNCVARRGKSAGTWLVGAEISATTATHDLAFFRTCDRCCPTNWDVGRVVWLSALAPTGGDTAAGAAAAAPEDTALLVTEPPFCPVAARRTSLQMYFEDLQFASVATKLASTLALAHSLAKSSPATAAASATAAAGTWAAVVVDAGFGASFVVPHVVAGANIVPVAAAVRRVDVGGKVLTNVLKEAVSFRHWNMMQEVALVRDIMERVCFVSQDFARDIRDAAHVPSRHYLLPDYSTSATGHVLTPSEMAAWLAAHSEGSNTSTSSSTEGTAVDTARCVRKMKAAGEQILSLGCEQFAVPEVLFNPSDVGINQYGVADAVADAVRTVSRVTYTSDSLMLAALTDALYARVLLRGGCARLPGFRDRMDAELRAVAPSRCPFSVQLSDEFAAVFPTDSPVRVSRLFSRLFVHSGEQSHLRRVARRQGACQQRRALCSDVGHPREVQRVRRRLCPSSSQPLLIT